MDKTDPSGQIIDTIADVAFIVADIGTIASEGATVTNVVALTADVVGAVLPGATGLGAGVRAISKGVERAAITVRAEQGAAREAKMAATLKAESPGARLQNQQALRTADGKMAKDPVTGEGRRVDHAVIEGGRAKTVETTSMKADKTGQLEKEQRIIDSGGNFVRDRDTKQLVPVCGVSEVRRCP